MSTDEGDLFNDRPEPGEALSCTLQIVNKKGLHARASAKFVQIVEGYDANVTVTRCGETVGGTSIMGLMMLAAATGTKIVVEARGQEAAAVIAALTRLVGSGFGEED